MTTSGIDEPRFLDPNGRLGLARAVALPLFLAGHVARLRSLDRSSVKVSTFSRTPPVPAAIDADQQAPSEGVGPLVMRRYEVDIAETEMSPGELIAALVARPNDFCSAKVAAFVRADAPATDVAIDDDLLIDLPGPWDASVRVRTTEPVMRLVTLDGHMEAGFIEFSAERLPAEVAKGGGAVRFRITSWARAGDSVFEFMHLRLKLAWELQTSMWVDMCVRACAIAGGVRNGRIRVRSEFLRGSDRSEVSS